MPGISESLGKEIIIVTDTHIKLPNKAFLNWKIKQALRNAELQSTIILLLYFYHKLPSALSLLPLELEAIPWITQKSVLQDMGNNF